MFDSLHHAREHLSLEQDLAILRWLTDGYGTDSRITEHRQHPRGLDRLRGQPRRRRVRPDRLALPRLAQEPPAEPGLDRDRDRPQPQLRLPLGVLRRLVELEVVVDLSRLDRVLGARDAGDPRLHGQPPDRRPPADQDRHHVPHRRRADPVAVRLHQDRHPGRHERRRPRRARRARQEDGRDRTATRPMQSSSLYVTDGDEIDWAYGHEHIFMYTFEMYPSHSQVSSTPRFYPPDELIGAADRAQQGRDPDAHRGRRLPVRRDRQGDPGLRPAVRHFETYGGWTTNPLGTDTATGGAWQRANPAATSRQAGTTPSGFERARHRAEGRRERRVVRRRRRRDDGPLAADRAARDGRRADLPLLPRPQLELVDRWTTSAPTSRTRTARGRSSSRSSGPRTRTSRPGRRRRISMTPWAGQTVRIVFAAADRGRASTVEAAVDDVRIRRP